MALLPGFNHDIFVSYAHVDNQPDLGVEKGWVSALITNLKNRLDRLIGRRDAYSLWWDPELPPYFQITPEISGTLEKSATLLTILSPAYLASDWCRKERNIFMEAVKGRAARRSGIFILERDKIEYEERPEALKDLPGYKFWTHREGEKPRTLGDPEPNPREDHEYYAKLDDVARDLKKELLRLQGEETHPRGTVYLAEVTDDLEPCRVQVERQLDQLGFQVLPEQLLPGTNAECVKVIGQDLEASLLFVQLLSHVVGKKPSGSDATFSRLQYEIAAKAGKPILQWRDPALDLNTVEDLDQRELLDGSEVRAVGFEDFKHQVCERAEAEQTKRERPTVRRASEAEPFIFVNCGPEDLDTAEKLCDALEECGCEWARPLSKGAPDKIRQHREENMKGCDGLIVVYGCLPPAWVHEQLRHWRKVRRDREEPLKALALYEAPPLEKDPLGMNVRNMQVINCRCGLNKQEIQPFLNALRCTEEP